MDHARNTVGSKTLYKLRYLLQVDGISKGFSSPLVIAQDGGMRESKKDLKNDVPARWGIYIWTLTAPDESTPVAVYVGKAGGLC